MPFGFLCCGPNTVNNVVDTSDDDDSDIDDAEVQRVRPPPIADAVDGEVPRRRLGGATPLEPEPSFMARLTGGFQVGVGSARRVGCASRLRVINKACHLGVGERAA